MKNNYKITAGLILVSVCFLLAACFSPLEGVATFTINLSGGGRMAYGPSDPGGAYPTVSDLKFVIDFTPTSRGTAKTIIKDGPTTDTITGTVDPGEYNVTVDIYLRADDSLYASGTAVAPSSNPVTIVSGTNSITIQVSMDPLVRGDGSPAHPFKVYDPDSLRKVGSETTPGGWTLAAHYILIQNINMAGQSFTPIGNFTNRFTGNFNGNGKTISNLVITVGGMYQGLFGVISGSAEVYNLGLIGGSVTGSDYIGGVVGLKDGGTVSNCYSTGNVSGTVDYVGGVVGRNDVGIVSNCYSTGNISGRSSVGGVVGESSGTVQNSYSTGTITGQETVGGIAGLNNGTVQNCYSTGNVSVTYYEAGGVVGVNQGIGIVTKCYFTGSISGENYIGGVVGSNIGTAEVSNCVALNTAILRTGGSDIDFGRVLVNASSTNISNNYGRCGPSDFYDVPTLTTFSPSTFNFDQLTSFHGAQITVAQWGSASWWTGTALFTDPWWNGRLPPVVP